MSRTKSSDCLNTSNVDRFPAHKYSFKMVWIWVHQSRIGNLIWEPALWSSLCPGSFSLSFRSWPFMIHAISCVRWQPDFYKFFSPNYYVPITFSSFISFSPNQLEGSFLFPPFSGPLTTLGTLRSAEGSKISEKWTWTSDEVRGFSFHFRSFGGSNAPYDISIHL